MLPQEKMAVFLGYISVAATEQKVIFKKCHMLLKFYPQVIHRSGNSIIFGLKLVFHLSVRLICIQVYMVS